MIHPRHVAVIHPGHVAVIHPRHVAMIHPGHVAMIHPRHVAVIHLGHVAVVHPGHVVAHVRHGEKRRLAARRQLGRQVILRCQGGARHAGTRHAFGDDVEGLGLFRAHDDVIGLGDGDTEFVDLDRLHVVAVGLHHGHLEARDAHVEERHCSSIDETQAHPLARLEKRRPILARALAIDQIRVAADIGDVGRHHAHLAPVEAIVERRGKAGLGDVVEERAERALLIIVVVGLHLEVGHDGSRRAFVPVRQHHDIFPVVAEGLAPLGLDNDGAV